MSDIQDEVIDNQPAPQPTPAPSYSPSADEIAAAVASRFAPPPSAAPQPFNAIVAASQKLKDDGWSDTAINAFTIPAQALRIETQQQMQGALSHTIRTLKEENKLNEAKRIVGSVITQFCADPEAAKILRKGDKSVRAAIEERAVKDPGFMSRWNQGGIDDTGLVAHATAECEDFLKTMGHNAQRTTPASPAVRTQSNVLVPSRSKPNQADVRQTASSYDDLEDHQRRFADDYESILVNKRVQNDDGKPMSRMEARKAAVERARVIPHSPLGGTAKARDLSRLMR